MAVTAIWHIGGRVDHLIGYIENPDKTEMTIEMEELTHIMEYTENPHKTEQKKYVSGINCIPEFAIEEFKETKLQYGKTDKRLAYHGYQSFAPGEVDPDTAHAIGKALAKEMWGNDYEVVVTTHLDRKHIHNHFAINSVSFRTGKKYVRSKAEYERMREVSDRLCRESQLSVIYFGADFKTPRYYHEAEKAGKMTPHQLLREDIDFAISQSKNLYEFNEVMQYMGYKLRYGKYLSFRLEGYSKSIRSYRLGDRYTVDSIKFRCQQNWEPQPKMWITIPKPKRYWNYNLPTPHLDPVTAPLVAIYYLAISVLLSVLTCIAEQNNDREKCYMHYVSPSLRLELAKLDQLQKQFKFLHHNDIKNIDELHAYRDEAMHNMAVIAGEREKMNKALGKEKDPEKLVVLKENRNKCSKAVQVLRNEIKLCDAIEDYSIKLYEKNQINERYEQKLAADRREQKIKIRNDYER